MTEEPTQQQAISDQPPTEYRFTDDEAAQQRQRRLEILLAKERIHDLNVLLEAEQTKLRELQALYQGAVEITMARMRMPQAEMTSDQARLVRKG